MGGLVRVLKWQEGETQPVAGFEGQAWRDWPVDSSFCNQNTRSSCSLVAFRAMWVTDATRGGLSCWRKWSCLKEQIFRKSLPKNMGLFQQNMPWELENSSFLNFVEWWGFSLPVFQGLVSGPGCWLGEGWVTPSCGGVQKLPGLLSLSYVAFLGHTLLELQLCNWQTPKLGGFNKIEVFFVLYNCLDAVIPEWAW